MAHAERVSGGNPFKSLIVATSRAHNTLALHVSIQQPYHDRVHFCGPFRISSAGRAFDPRHWRQWLA